MFTSALEAYKNTTYNC